jgi:hypothetical protein
MIAARETAQIMRDYDFMNVIDQNLKLARETIDELMWTGDHWVLFWMPNDPKFPKENIGPDILYAQIWMSLLGLPDVHDRDRMKSHLRYEYYQLQTPLGLKMMKGVDCSYFHYAPNDTGGWEAPGIDHSTIGIVLGEDPATSLNHGAFRILDKYQRRWNMQWDYKDISATINNSTTGWPTCNSHYSRQSVMWAIIPALTGQLYDAVSQVLSFAPRKGFNLLPWMTPSADGYIDSSMAPTQYTVSVTAGAIELQEIRVFDKYVRQSLNLTVGSSVIVQ